jgi:methylated-DNA-[protein]-cysteine S-methyltransferase
VRDRRFAPAPQFKRYKQEVNAMSQINIQYYKTKIGELILGTSDEKLCILDFRYRKMRTTVDNRIKKGLNAEFIEQGDDVIEKTK